MNPHLALALGILQALAVARGQGFLPADQFAALARQHTDGLCVLHNSAGSPPLSIVAWQRDAGLDLPTNQVMFIVKDEAKLTLPAGTPFGEAGQPLWILPQSQNTNLLYLGINVERVPSGIFSGPIAIQLKRFEGPGYFMAWQASGPGHYTIRIDTRDGVGVADFFQPLVGAHEHFNWGFSTTGVYCATFQAVGQRVGEGTNSTSAESTFVFHVQPLPPATNFATWQKHFWPPGFNPPTTRTNGNPDGDAFENLHEYAFGLSPTNGEPIAAAPLFSFVTIDGGGRHGALTFTRYLPALDLNPVIEATDALPGPWSSQSNVLSVQPGPTHLTERVSIRDTLPATGAQRFLRLRVNLE